jgi:acyl-CoA synthetase (AMP-forming)/AMP-acid ligase II
VQSKCVLMDRIDAPGVAAWVRRDGICTFASVPTTFHDLLTHPDVKKDDLASLTRPTVGGAPPPDALKALFLERFGFEIQEGYGLTEAPTSVTHTDPTRPRIPGSCGQAQPHQLIRILGDDGSDA